MPLYQSDSRPRPIVGWDEEDVYTPWRHRYCYTQRAGVVKRIKQATHKRERREARAEIRSEYELHLEPVRDFDHGAG